MDLLLGLVPPTVKTTYIHGDTFTDPLFPEEYAALGRVADRRLIEFSAGRACARRALFQLGIPPMPILIGTQREPLWPMNVVGSITHCEAYSAAAVAHSTHCLAIGIDAEPNDVLPRDTIDLIAGDQERKTLLRLPQLGICWDRLLFSAKESVFKAWSPTAREWLGFEDVLVTFDYAQSMFRASFLVDTPFPALTGRYRWSNRYITTAVVVEVPTP
jgi:4'-phosphopantetheinyl transferase EntD